MGAEELELKAAVAGVVDPELGMTLGAAGMVHDVRLRRRKAVVTLALPVAPWPPASVLDDLVRSAARAVAGVEEVEVATVTMGEPGRLALRAVLREEATGGTGHEDVSGSGGPAGHGNGGGHDHGGGGHGHGGGGGGGPSFLQPGSRTRVLGISSGKGGVGKSSVTVNLAVALAREGYEVGILDADVYGFSVPKMLGVDHDPVILGDLVVPVPAHGVRCLSIGFFVPDDQPVIWRGPMLHKAIQQFLEDAYWGRPDFLLVDMPPGTGDVALSLAEFLPRAEIFVVTTPQPAAQRVAQRSAFAARKLKLSVRGVIENMSWFTGDDGTRYELFGSGGGAALAADLDVPLLGQVPLLVGVREGGDHGVPVAADDPDSEAAAAFAGLARAVVDLGPARVYRRELSVAPGR